MKFLVSGGAAFVVALIASTIVGFMMAPPPPKRPATQEPPGVEAPVDSVAAAVDAVPASQGAPELTTLRDTSASQAASVPQRGAASKAPEPVTPPVTPARLASVLSGPVRIEVRSYGDVAKILVNMKPKDAGQILARMNDDNVEGILNTLGPRQAAVLLTQLPAERAAALSLRLIQHTPREKR